MIDTIISYRMMYLSCLYLDFVKSYSFARVRRDGHEFMIFDDFHVFHPRAAGKAGPCSTSSPSGNLVGGLLLVAHTGAGLTDATCTVISRSDVPVCVLFVLAILLLDLDETFVNIRYMYI